MNLNRIQHFGWVNTMADRKEQRKPRSNQNQNECIIKNHLLNNHPLPHILIVWVREHTYEHINLWGSIMLFWIETLLQELKNRRKLPSLQTERSAFLTQFISLLLINQNITTKQPAEAIIDVCSNLYNFILKEKPCIQLNQF